MLVRRPQDGSEVAIHQEQHALVSGMLAAAWRPSLHPRLITVVTLHDAPWRSVDATPRHDEDGRLVDFVGYPVDERLDFYSDGITELEAVDPYVAYMVSLHYSSFAGMAKMTEFREDEQARRERLEPLLGPLHDLTAEHLRWLQYFDVFSLHLCLTGPDVPSDHLPVWLRDPARWSTSPDGREFDLEWTGATNLRVNPLPFEGPLKIGVSVWRNGERDHIELVVDG